MAPDFPIEPPEPEPAEAVESLAPVLYRELKQIAQRLFRKERREHTLQPTAIVHEAFLRLSRSHELSIKDRVHFLRLAARTMRRVLADHARRRPRGVDRTPLERVTLTDGLPESGGWTVGLRDLDRALEKLRQENPRDADIVELRCFAGLNHSEIAELLGVSVSTVEKSWRFARSWLMGELEP